MPYPNSALSAWQLAIMAVVAVAALAGWLTAVFLAAREPRPDATAATSPGAAPAEKAGTTAAPRLGATEAARRAGDREAA